VETLFFSFFPCFSLSSLLLRAKTLSSLSSCLLLLRRESSGGGGGGAVAGRPRRRRRRLKCFFLKFFFILFSSTLSPLHVCGLKISKLFIKMPRSKKRKKGNLYFCFFLCVFGSGVGSLTDSAERVVCGLSWFVQSV